MMQKLVLTLGIAVLLFSCKTGSDKSSESEAAIPAEKAPAVSVYNYSKYGLGLYQDMDNLKKSIAHIKLGEVVTFLGETATDTVKDRDYKKVELSDGTVGWAYSSYLIVNAQPAVVIEGTPVYERPDILTKMIKKEYKSLEVVAITETKEEWYKVIGINKTNQGWINKKHVSTKDDEVASAILARYEIYDTKGNLLEDKLSDFVENAPYPNTMVISTVKDMIAVEEGEEEELVFDAEAKDSI